jgi:hypothetical protein
MRRWDDPRHWRHRQRWRGAFAAVANAVIDPYDIARVAAAALTSDRHDGRMYRLSGPESLLPADQVRVLGSVLGRDLRLQAQSDEQAHREMSASMPAGYVRAFFSFYVDGTLDESRVLPTVEQVTGERPRTFRAVGKATRGRLPLSDSHRDTTGPMTSPAARPDRAGRDGQGRRSPRSR